MTAELDCDWQSVDVGDKEMGVYVCGPRDGSPRPAVLVLQEIFGVNHHIRKVAERIAREGYLALAPDLFHRQGDRLEADYTEVPRARERKAKLRDDEFLGDMRRAMDLAAERNGSDYATRTGVVGFCFGGRLAYLAACHLPLSAAAVFYGGGITAGPLERTAGILCPMLLCFGGNDSLIPRSDIERIERTLKEHDKTAEVVLYAEAGHGFFCEDRADYHPNAAADAWERLKQLMAVLR